MNRFAEGVAWRRKEDRVRVRGVSEFRRLFGALVVDHSSSSA